jgi:lactoylglutathione lyase
MGASPGREIVFLGEGETKVELICGNDGQSSNIGKDIAIGFEVKSLDETMAMVQEKGIAIFSGPVQPNPHIRFFYVLDPDGLKVQFVENS